MNQIDILRAQALAEKADARKAEKTEEAVGESKEQAREALIRVAAWKTAALKALQTARAAEVARVAAIKAKEKQETGGAK